MKELTAAQMDLVVSAVIKVHKKQLKKEGERERDRRLRNVKLILRNYSAFKKYAEQSSRVDSGCDEEQTKKKLVLNGEDIVNSIRMTTNRTLVMIRHLENALAALEYISKQEPEGVSARLHYDVIRQRYIDKRAIAEIAKIYVMNERTVYKLLDAAAERLSVMLFGVYGLELE